MNLFNRTVLVKEPSAEEAAKIYTILRKNNIPYEMKTLRNKTTFGRNLHYRMNYGKYNGGMSSSFVNQDLNYLYIIYVKKKDYTRAVELIDTAV